MREDKKNIDINSCPVCGGEVEIELDSTDNDYHKNRRYSRDNWKCLKCEAHGHLEFVSIILSRTIVIGEEEQVVKAEGRGNK